VTSPRAARRTALAFAIIAAFAVGACGASSVTEPPDGGAVATTAATLPLEVSVADAATLRDDGAFVLDVRQPDEWTAGHIEGATLIPLGELAARVAEVPRDRDVVVVCRSGNRSAQGRDILLGAGYASVTSMAGGMNDWTGSGLPAVTGP
jgi:rhodanese-related sulfurtransferase